MNFDAESQMGILLSRYIDNELSEAERVKVEEHLKDCKDCRETLSIFRRNEQILRGALSIETFGNEVVEKVMERISPSSNRLSRRILRAFARIPRPAWGGLAAAVAVAALLLVIIAQSAMLSNIHDQMARLSGIQRRIDQELLDAASRERRLYRELQAHQAALQMERYGSGVYCKPLPGQIRLFLKLQEDEASSLKIYRREEGHSAWNQPIAEVPAAQREFVDSDVEPNKTYEYRVEVLSPIAMLKELKSPPVSCRTDPVLMNIRPPSDYFLIHCRECDSRTALIEVRRVIHGREYSQAYTIQIGQELGTLEMDPSSPADLDFRTGYVLDSVREKEVPTGCTSNGDLINRVDRQIVLKPKNGRGAPVECTEGSSVTLPIRR